MMLGGRTGRQRDAREADPVERVTPVPDRYAGGVVFPGRGQETHGVTPTDDPRDPPRIATEVALYGAPEPEPEPIPVRVVTESKREVKRFRVFREFASTGSGRVVIGANDRRTVVRIRNMDAVRTVYIGDEASSALPAHGWPIPPNSVSPDIVGQNEIYAMTDDGTTQVALAVMVEYPVEL